MSIRIRRAGPALILQESEKADAPQQVCKTPAELWVALLERMGANPELDIDPVMAGTITTSTTAQDSSQRSVDDDEDLEVDEESVKARRQERDEVIRRLKGALFEEAGPVGKAVGPYLVKHGAAATRRFVKRMRTPVRIRRRAVKI